jgi:hypothetical protein
MTFKVPEKYRVKRGPAATTLEEHGLNGMFWIPLYPGKPPMKIIATDGIAAAEDGMPPWEHVSASFPNRCPTWEEMCRVKAMFWDDEDCVMQLHPPRSQWVNNHPYCLHLWRPLMCPIPQPPAIMVGVAAAGVLA